MEVMLGETFRKLQNAGSLPVGKPIKVLWTEKQTYMFSPDGVGCYYYDTLEDLEENH